MKKLKLPSEVVYLAAIVLLAFSVAMLTSVDFGISMIVAPAYILSLVVPITFGQAEYVIQAILFVIFCIVMKNFRISYLSSFITCLLYGAVLDLFRLIPIFNPAVTPPGSMDLWVRIVMFILGVPMSAFSIALFSKTYLYPEVYDLFFMGIRQKILHKNRGFQNLFRRFYARSRHDDDACVFQKFRRNQLGHARYDGVQRNFDKSVFKAARQVCRR